MGRIIRNSASASFVKSSQSRSIKQTSSSSSSDWTNHLKSFRFPSARVYSHKGSTILIHSGNYDKLEDIVNYEISTSTAKQRGFILLHLHDEIRPLISDQSVLKFLIQSGDHEKAKTKMSAGFYTYDNVYSKHSQNDPLGLVCLKFLLDSVKTGKSVSELIEENKSKLQGTKKPDNEKKPEEEGKSPEGEVPAKSGTDSTNQEEDEDSEPVLSAMWNDVVPQFLIGNFSGGRFLDHKYVDKQGKMMKKCPCRFFNHDHSINDLNDHSRGQRPLLHEAYLGQSRLHSFPEPSGTINSADLNRLNDSELRDCERILHRLLQGKYNYEYMIKEGFVKVEGQHSFFGTTRQTFDLENTKNPIDDCFRGNSKTGITFPWTYLGFAGSIFAIHVEDIAYLNSVNLMLYGSPKVWIFVGEEHAVSLQEKTFEYLRENAVQQSSQFLKCTLQHKMTFVHPALMDLWGIPYTVVVQKPGDMIYTCGGSFHSGFNLGVNINLAKNTIQTDYKLRMLKELYVPANDLFRCRPSCPQNQTTYLEDGSTGSYLVSFYNMLFKCQRGNKEDVAFQNFLHKFYSGAEIGPDPVALDEEIQRVVQQKLAWKTEQVLRELAELKSTVIDFMPRLKTDVILERKVTFSLVPDLEVESNSDKVERFPSEDVILTQSEENDIFNQLPFTHILVSHKRYGTVEEMCLSRNTELSSEHDEVKQIATSDTNSASFVWRTFQYFNDVNKYWMNVADNYAEISTSQKNPTNKSHENMIDHVQTLNNLANDFLKKLGAERIKTISSIQYSADEEVNEAQELQPQHGNENGNLPAHPNAIKKPKLSCVKGDGEMTQVETNVSEEIDPIPPFSLEQLAIHYQQVAIVTVSETSSNETLSPPDQDETNVSGELDSIQPCSQEPFRINQEEVAVVNVAEPSSNPILSPPEKNSNDEKEEDDTANELNGLLVKPSTSSSAKCSDETLGDEPTTLGQSEDLQPKAYRILCEAHNLILIVVRNKLYYICTICFNFYSNIVVKEANLQKQNKTFAEIERELEAALKRRTGVTGKAFNMRQHIRKYIKALKCNLCDDLHTFKTKHVLACHIRTIHQSHLIYCPLCSQAFHQPGQLRQHWMEPSNACVLLLLSHGPQKKVMGFECKQCKEIMHKREQWQQHIKTSPECIGRRAAQL